MIVTQTRRQEHVKRRIKPSLCSSTCWCGAQIAQLSRELSETSQKLEATRRLYEAEAAVAGQSAEHSRRDSEQLARLEGRLAEALAAADAAEQAKDAMEQQLRQAQVHSFHSILLACSHCMHKQLDTQQRIIEKLYRPCNQTELVPYVLLPSCPNCRGWWNPCCWHP